MYRAVKVRVYPTDEQESYLAQFNLSSAFVNFFEGHAKFLNFKSKHGKQSIQYPQNVKLIPQDSVIKFPGSLGIVKAVFHKKHSNAKFTTVTISKNADGRYYASILFNQVDGGNIRIRTPIGQPRELERL